MDNLPYLEFCTEYNYPPMLKFDGGSVNDIFKCAFLYENCYM